LNLQEFLIFVINLNLIGDHAHLFGFLWLSALTFTFYLRLKHLMPAAQVDPNAGRIRKLWANRKPLFTAFAIGWFIQLSIDEFVTFWINLLSGSWSMVELQLGSFTLTKLLWFKADCYFQWVFIFFVFTISNTWQYLQATKRALFWLILIILFQSTLSVLHIWNHHPYQGTELIIVFFLTYPEFRTLTGFFGSNIVRKPQKVQDTKAEQLWFNSKFNAEMDLRDEEEFRKVFNFFQITPGMKGLLLDAGCGYGSYGKQLLNNGFRVIGTDSSIKMLRQNNSETILSDVAISPFPDATFSHIFVAGVLHHFQDLQEPMLEFQRILKPGGKLFIYEPSGSNIMMKFLNISAHALLPHQWLMKFGATPNERLHRLGIYERFLRKYGFRVCKKATMYIEHRTFFPFRLNSLIRFGHRLAPSFLTDTHIVIAVNKCAVD